MLKVRKVYLYNKKTYYYVAEIKKYKGRNTYTVNKINSDGSLGPDKKILFRRGKFTEAKKYWVNIHITLPSKDRDKIRYETVIDQGREIIKIYRKSRNKKQNDIYRERLAQIAMAACIYFNKETGNNYNLEDVARSFRLKSGKTLYKWVASYHKRLFTFKKYKSEIPNASDATVLITIRNYQKFWASYHGFSKELNKLLEIDLKAYTKELRGRGLRL